MGWISRKQSKAPRSARLGETMSFRLGEEASENLRRLCEASGNSPEEAMRKALALMAIAVEESLANGGRLTLRGNPESEERLVRGILSPEKEKEIAIREEPEGDSGERAMAAPRGARAPRG